MNSPPLAGLPPLIWSLVRVFLLSGLLLNLAAALGMQGLVQSPLFTLIILSQLLLLVWAVALALRFIWQSWIATPSLLVRSVAASLILIGSLSSLALTLLPITARDALIHHLAVPRWWVNLGSVTPVSWHDWSYYPMALQTSYAAFIDWGTPNLAAPYHWCFAVVLMALTGALSLLLSPGTLALLAVAIMGTLPVVIKLASVPLVDLGLAAYSIAALLLALQWRATPRIATLGWLGVALGLCASTKPNGLLFGAIVAIAFLGWCLVAPPPASGGAHPKTHHMFQRVWPVLLACLVAGIAFSPWPAQNFLHTGNPLYPLGKRFFTSAEQTLPRTDAPAPLSPLETRRLLHGESWTEIAALPLRIFIQGEDDNPKRFDGRLSPVLLLAFAALLMRPRSSALVFTGLITLTYLFVALLLTDTRVRYFAPIYGPLAALTGACLASLCLHTRRPLLLQAAVLGFQLLWSGSYVVDLARRVKAPEYFSGPLTREEYLEYAIPEYRSIRWMNQHLSPSTHTLLLLTGNRFYYFDTPVRSEGYHSASTFFSMVREASDAPDLAARLHSRHVTHLLIHGARLASLASSQLSDTERSRLDDFFRSTCRLEFKDRGFFLFSLIPDATVSSAETRDD